MTTPLILKGDKRDSSRQFQDRLRELKTTYNMQAFMNEDIDAEEPYSGQEATKFKQEQNVGNMLLELVRLADPTSDLRSKVRNIEISLAFSTQVQKMRKIIHLYEEETAPNPEKNSHLKAERSALTFKSHGIIELQRDVDKMLNKISTIEEEMEDGFKWNTTHKIEKIMNLLHDVKELNNFFEGTKTYDSATTYDQFKTGLLQACSGIADRERNQRPQIMSANSTQGTVDEPTANSTETAEADLFKQFKEWSNTSRNSRSRDRNYERERPRDRSYSKDRGNSRDGRGYSRDRRGNSRDGGRGRGRNWRRDSRSRSRERYGNHGRHARFDRSESEARNRDWRTPPRSAMRTLSQLKSPYHQGSR